MRYVEAVRVVGPARRHLHSPSDRPGYQFSVWDARMTPPTSAIEQTLSAASRGDRQAAAELLPLVYNELRSLARARLGHVPAGNTLQPTALVHEAYMRLVGDRDPGWDTRGHFFAAAAEAMRQVLVDQARRKKRLKRGGDRKRIEGVEEFEVPLAGPVEDILALDEAIERLKADDERKAQIVTLRCFAGLNREETAAALGISVPTIDREWRYIVARLHKELTDGSDDVPGS
jgi:RNA polymerase sigma factor (TIGR02999 family)